MNLKYSLKLLLLLGLFFAVNSVSSQETKLLRGQIFSDSIPISNIHVVNLSLETGTTSDSSGKFNMYARKGDTLFFSSIQYYHKNIIVKDSTFNSMLIVNLREKLNELDEVQLDDIKLSGVLSKDIDKVPKSNYEKLGIAFPKPRRTSLALEIHSASNGGNITTLLNTLNGKFKQLKKAKATGENSILVNKAFELFGEIFFISQLGIPQEEIFNFLYYCSEYPNFSGLVEGESALLLIEFFKNHTESFKELRGLE